MNGWVCGPPSAAVRADLVLERGDLVELGVVQRVDHQVGGGAVRVDLGRPGRGAAVPNGASGSSPVTSPVARSTLPCAPRTTDGPAGRADEHEADRRVLRADRGSGGGSARRSPRGSADACRPAGRSGRGLPEPSTIGSSSRCGGVGSDGLVAPQPRLDSVRPCSASSSPGLGGAPAQASDEFGERLAGALGERRPLGLAVVGQHDDPVRARRPVATRSIRPIWRSRSRSTASVSARSGPEWWATSS